MNNVKVSTISKTNIHIVGDNILYNNGVVTAFYIIPLVNYSTNTSSGVINNISSLVNTITNLTTTYPTIMFTIERIEKVIKRKDVLANLLETIQIYRPEFEMPLEFTNRVRDDVQSYCLLGIDIKNNTIADVEDYTIKDTLKSLFKSAVNALMNNSLASYDPEGLLKIEENIFRTINNHCVRASKELVFYNFISKVFPCYEISYDKLSYINENNFETIMGVALQSISDDFGKFEMHNEGVELFDLEPQTTYGCMLDVHSFPPKIDPSYFPVDYPNTVTTIRCLRKEDAKIKLKRTRSSIRFERDQAIDANAELETIEEQQSNINIATRAIEALEDGEILCEFNTSILVYAETFEELKARVMRVITNGKDRGILIAKSLNQALDFSDNYINKKPRGFNHLAPLMFPLSFQQNYGASVGDTGTNFWSPEIGYDL